MANQPWGNLMSSNLRHRHRRHVLRASLLALLLGASACSSSSDGDDASQAVEAEPAQTTLLEEAPPVVDEADDSEAEIEIVTFPSRPSEDRTEYRTSTMGGVSFEVGDGDSLLPSGDMIVVSDQPIDEFGPTASVGLVSQLMSGDPVATQRDFVDAIESVPEAAIEPTGTAIDLLGYRLTGYRVEAPVAAADTLLFADQRLGSEPQSGFAPFPLGVVFLAETPSGLLTAEMTFFEPEQEQALEPAFGTLLESVAFTGPGLDIALNSDLLAAEEPSGAPAPPAVVAEGGPSVLGAPFSPVEPGTYVVDNFGRALVLDLAENWFVLPNFPGFVVLGAPGSIGPGDRDLVMLNGVVDAVPTAGPIRAGEAVALDDIDAFLAAPPSAISVSGIERFDIDGTEIVQFDLVANPEADCSVDDPCDLTFRTNYGAEKPTASTQTHRIWWFVDHPNGPAMIIAMDSVDGAFIDQATAVMQTARLLD